jgi:hypothetical protein
MTRCCSDSRSSGTVTAIRSCGPFGGSAAKRAKKISYKGYRFPPEIIRHAIWLYLRFTVSFRDVEDLLAERLTAIVPPLGTSDKARTLSSGL